MAKPRGLQPHAWAITRVLRLILRIIVRWRLFHVTALGRNHIPSRGAGIIACNHLSLADPVVVWGSVPRNLVAVAMKELWRTPLVLIMWLLGHIAVDRGNRESGAKVREKMKRVLTNHGLLLIFPEGKCSRDGVQLPFKRGVVDIAIETNTLIIPAGIAGSNEVWPLGRHLPWHRRKQIAVVYGEPLDPMDFASAQEMLQVLEQSVARLTVQALLLITSKQ